MRTRFRTLCFVAFILAYVAPINAVISAQEWARKRTSKWKNKHLQIAATAAIEGPGTATWCTLVALTQSAFASKANGTLFSPVHGSPHGEEEQVEWNFANSYNMTWLDSPFKSEISLQNPVSVARQNRLILRLKAHFPCKEARSKCPARRVEEIFYSGTTMHLASAWRPGTVTEVGAERSGSISVIPTDYTLTQASISSLYCQPSFSSTSGTVQLFFTVGAPHEELSSESCNWPITQNTLSAALAAEAAAVAPTAAASYRDELSSNAKWTKRWVFPRCFCFSARRTCACTWLKKLAWHHGIAQEETYPTHLRFERYYAEDPKGKWSLPCRRPPKITKMMTS